MLLFLLGTLQLNSSKRTTPCAYSLIDPLSSLCPPTFGNPATSRRPVALRPHLAVGLPFPGLQHDSRLQTVAQVLYVLTRSANTKY